MIYILVVVVVCSSSTNFYMRYHIKYIRNNRVIANQRGKSLRPRVFMHPEESPLVWQVQLTLF